MKKTLTPILGISMFLIACFLFEIYYLGENTKYFSFHGKDNFLGFLTYGLFHANWVHLMGNLFWFVVFGTVLQKFYFKRSNFKLIIWFYFATGFLHVLMYQFDLNCIGASGWIFALCWYVIIKGVISDKVFNICLSIILLYANSYLVIGMSPAAGKVAWDCHLAGGIIGALTCFINLPFLKEHDK